MFVDRECFISLLTRKPLTSRSCLVTLSWAFGNQNWRSWTSIMRLVRRRRRLSQHFITTCDTCWRCSADRLYQIDAVLLSSELAELFSQVAVRRVERVKYRVMEDLTLVSKIMESSGVQFYSAYIILLTKVTPVH